MLARLMRSRGVARAAVVGLAAGIGMLAGLTLWATHQTTETTSSVRSADAIGDRWIQVLLHVSTEYEAMTDYVRADSAVGRQPLASAIGSAREDLAWLTTHGTADDRESAREVTQNYVDFTATLRYFARLHRDDRRQLRLHAAVASLSASSLRKQAVTNASRNHDDLNASLDEAAARNGHVLVAEASVLCVDILLLALFTLLLLNHQRRVERQAEDGQHQARHDALTGVANRILLGERLNLALADSAASGRPGALLLLDLDGFKQVNDTRGHQCGDVLLQEVARRLTEVMREPADLVSRLGGDEFAILLPAFEQNGEPVEIAARVREALMAPMVLAEAPVRIGVSIGVALFPRHGTSPGEILQRADIAMYVAKRGRLGIAEYRTGEKENLTRTIGLINDLRLAVGRGELDVHYQPKLTLGSGVVAGVEALCRWEHPELGMVSPARFIPLAEENDLIVPLTVVVLRRALADQRRWRQLGVDVPVAVNVSVTALNDLELIERVSQMLAEFGCRPDHLVLEITESAVSEDPETALAVLTGLRRLGIRTSIDDFGAGYSSMSQLLRLPVDELKIDRSLVTSVGMSGGEDVLRAIIQLGHALGLSVVAEGVEEAETLDRMAALGCDQAQGFHLLRPVAADALETWLADRLTRSTSTGP